MTKKPTDTEWKVEYAKRCFGHITERATKDIRRQIETIRRRLDEAEACLEDEERTPGQSGVIQSAACELELAVGRLLAMREAKMAIKTLVEVASLPEGER